MDILRKISEKKDDLLGKKNPVIAFLGDSVTQGCFECFIDEGNGINTVFDVESCFSSYLKHLFKLICPETIVNIINSGISGDNAGNGLNRIERDVFSYNPDLVVVGYALNDCCGGENGLLSYENNIKNIVKKIKDKNIECILLTPNMMNTKISCHLDKNLLKFAENFKDLQNNGTLDKYVDVIHKVAKEENVPVCDMYSMWKNLENYNFDTTSLLANFMNHPKREIHKITALKLFECMLNN